MINQDRPIFRQQRTMPTQAWSSATGLSPSYRLRLRLGLQIISNTLAPVGEALAKLQKTCHPIFDPNLYIVGLSVCDD